MPPVQLPAMLALPTQNIPLATYRNTENNVTRRGALPLILRHSGSKEKLLQRSYHSEDHIQIHLSPFAKFETNPSHYCPQQRTKDWEGAMQGIGQNL